MYSHFSVILLCFSGVYCISSQIENLDLNGLRQILNNETTIKEWETVMDQDIYYREDAQGPKITVNVKRAVDEFTQKVNNGDVTEFEKVRNIIVRAYQCTLAKYANLNAFLMVNDVNALNSSIDEVSKLMTLLRYPLDDKRIFQNATFLKLFEEASGTKYHLDFDFKFQSNTVQLISHHEFVRNPWKIKHIVLAKLIEKDLGFKIKYRTYPTVFNHTFSNPYDLPDVNFFNEFVCILNEVIKMFDNFIVDKCVQHDGSFQKNFQSLNKGINNKVTQLTKYIDKKKREGLELVLYKDFSNPGPGTSQSVNEIRASGGFVEKVEFEISGLKMDLTNDKNPTEIYGHDINARIVEPVVLKLKASPPNPKNVIKAGMLLFRDNENLPSDQPSQRDSGPFVGITFGDRNTTYARYRPTQ